NGPSELIDIDGDGDLDIISARSNGTAGIQIALNDGNGNFSSVSDVSLLANAMDLGDFDGDGVLDLVTIRGDHYALYTGDGDGTFTLSFTGPSTPGSSNNWVQFGDVNNDDRLDIIVSHYDDEYIAVHLGDG